ncbi:MAG TPA: Calx-beta domain-containing protein, partial [Acidimicrobiia bacterium]|nr:Calx-beta domain-containing protein [Acidimicrobiia bacterium]
MRATLVISLSEASTQPVTVEYETVDGSAVAGEDYGPKEGSVTIPPGSTSATVTVRVKGDVVPEPDEVFYVLLSEPTNAVLSDLQGAVTIVDDDVTVEIRDAWVAEPEPGGVATAIFEVRLSAPRARTIAVDFRTEDGSAVAGEDYEPVEGTLVFRPGEVAQTISVDVYNDQATGLDETFYVSVAPPERAMLVRALGEATVVQADRVVSIFGTAVLEPPPGVETLAIFQVSLAVPTSGSVGVVTGSPSSKPIWVDFTTFDGTAVAGEDYEPMRGTLLFNPGEGSKTIAVPVRNDGVPGPDESFSVVLSNPVNARLSSPVAWASITSTNRALNMEDTTVTEGNAPGVYATFVLTLPLATSEPVTVRYTTVDGTALAGQDYAPQAGTVVFEPGELSRTVRVAVTSDLVDEGETPEFFYVDLSSPVGAALARPRATATIADDDGEPASGRATDSQGGSGPVAGLGYWLVGADGRIFGFGGARVLGSTGDIPLQRPIVGMAATPTGLCYWLVAA